MLASVRTNTVPRPPVYFFGDSLGLLGVGEGRQRETIEASLVFEEEEEEETSKAFEEKEGVEDFKKDQDILFVRNDETKAFKKEQNRTVETGTLPVEEAKKLMMCERRNQKEVGKGHNRETGSKKVALLPAECSTGQIIPTSVLSPTPPLPPLPLTTIVKTHDHTSPLPENKNEEDSLLLSTISGPRVVQPPCAPSPPPAESRGDSLTREQIIELYTSSNSPDQSSL